jgi:serine O-acetyltransferase
MTRTRKNPETPHPIDPRAFETAVDALTQRLAVGGGLSLRNTQYHLVPSRDALAGVVEGMRSIFFPGFFGSSEMSDTSVRFHIGATLDRVGRTLQEQIEKGLSFECDNDPHGCQECPQRAAELTHAFLARLPEVRRMLATDVKAAYEGDPAATRTDEVIICYPGMLAITNHRLAHELYRLEVPLLPRIISEHAHSITGIDLHPGAQIDEEFFIDHGTGVVIGETSVIGKRVRIYQGVTLGAKSFPLDEHGNPIKGIPRHPLVEDDVVIYGGATILGRITIGKGSIIGGNIWLTESVPPGSRVTQARARQDLFSEGAGI